MKTYAALATVRCRDSDPFDKLVAHCCKRSWRIEIQVLRQQYSSRRIRYLHQSDTRKGNRTACLSWAASTGQTRRQKTFRQQIKMFLSAISNRKRVLVDQTRYGMARAKLNKQPGVIVSAVRGWLGKLSIGFLAWGLG
jgi:hypothetical protein